MRQRMDEIGSSLKQPLRQIVIDLLKHYHIEPSAMDNGFVQIDIDVSPFINEKCVKEGISKTYKLKDGYAPIFATLEQKVISSQWNFGRESSIANAAQQNSSVRL